VDYWAFTRAFSNEGFVIRHAESSRDRRETVMSS